MTYTASDLITAICNEYTLREQLDKIKSEERKVWYKHKQAEKKVAEIKVAINYVEVTDLTK